MAAVLLRLCDEDREKFGKPGWPEWIRFDEKDLDDLDLVTLNQFEADLNVSLEFLLLVDKPSRTVRWTAARVWMGLQMAGHKVPPLAEFPIKVRRVEVRDEVKAEDPKPSRGRKKAGDADPPSSSPSSEAEASETVSG